MSFARKCFISDDKKVIPFNPEIDVEEIEVTEQMYKRYFPFDASVDFRRLRLSNIGKYSIVEPSVQAKILNRMLNDLKSTNATITDACGNMGGMTISFARVFSNVNSCEIVPLHCEILKNNIDVYGLTQKVHVVCGDYIDHMETLKQDAIVFDPPWGGVDYKTVKHLQLHLDNVNICCIIDRLLSRTKFIYMMVPPNYSFADLKLVNKKYKIDKIKVEPTRGKYSKLLLVFSHAVGGRRKTRRRR